MEVNTLAFIVVLLFLAVPTAFLLIPYVKTASAEPIVFLMLIPIC